MNKSFFGPAKKCRVTAMILIISIVGSFAVPMVSLAAAPSVSLDETLYGNMDYYGRISDASVVKECRLNGNTQFEDYGRYKSVVNMSNYAVPVLSPSSVSWGLNDIADNKPFYYQCYLDVNAVSLPWSFDVSYKLDGVPKKAEELAGASGLVEINIQAIPNEQAADYYKNNMLLQVATIVNMEDTKSIEAPGAQLQSVGTYKGIIFVALPGEEKTFTIRIGAGSFENSGIMMTMIPGTLDQLKKIKELKEAKDTMKESYDAIYFATNDIMDILTGMREGALALNGGLSNLDNAANTISAFRDDVSGNTGQSIEDLTALTEQTAKMIPHLQQGQNFVNDINDDIQNLMDSIEDTKTTLEDFKYSAKKSKKALIDLRDMLEEMEDHQDEAKERMEELTSDLEEMKDDLGALNTNISTLKSGLAQLQSAEAGLADALNSMDGSDPYIGAVQISGNATIASVQAFCQITEGIIDTLQSSAFPKAEQMMADMGDAAELCTEYMDIWEEHQDSMDDLLQELIHTCGTAQTAAEQMITIIDDSMVLRDKLESYKDEAISLLKDSEKLTVRMTRSMENATAFLKTLKNILDQSGDQIDAGTRESLQGMIRLIDKSIAGIDEVPAIRKANDTMKKTIDEQIDKFEKENRFLNLDTEMKLQSFTSNKNPTPNSIQVIMRTAEISLDNDNKSNADLEKSSENIGILARIRQIFNKIWSEAIGIFK